VQAFWSPSKSSKNRNTSIETITTKTNAEERPRHTKAGQQKHTLVVDKETTTSTLRSKEETLPGAEKHLMVNSKIQLKFSKPRYSHDHHHQIYNRMLHTCQASKDQTRSLNTQFIFKDKRQHLCEVHLFRKIKSLPTESISIQDV